MDFSHQSCGCFCCSVLEVQSLYVLYPQPSVPSNPLGVLLSSHPCLLSSFNWSFTWFVMPYNCALFWQTAISWWSFDGILGAQTTQILYLAGMYCILSSYSAPWLGAWESPHYNVDALLVSFQATVYGRAGYQRYAPYWRPNQRWLQCR